MTGRTISTVLLFWGLLLAAGWIPSARAENDESPASTDSPSASQVLPLGDEEIVGRINELIRQAWSDEELRPSKTATDGEWCRRLYLDLIGRIPTAEETERFLNDRSKQKRADLVRALTTSDEYVELFARNWTTIWTNVLIGRTGGLERRTVINRAGLQQYLRRALLRDKPYDHIVADLLTAAGSNTPGQDNYNGAVNFLVGNLGDSAVQATTKTAQIFLGVQIQCTQCHDHPFNSSWKMRQFWGFNGFFRQARALRTFEGRNIVNVKLADQDYGGPASIGDPENAVVSFDRRDGTNDQAFPTFLDGTRINPSGYLSDVNRREELAGLIVRSEYLDPAVVNRTWAHFFGYGFTKPVDDMGPHNPVSHPELLEFLARQFQAHGRDLKQLMRWITASEAYALSSRITSKNEADDPAAGEIPMFSHFYVRQMRVEEVFESLSVATRAAAGNDYEQQDELRRRWLRQFTIAFDTDENDETTTFNGTIPQTLMMMNGELIEKAVACEPGTFLHDVATAELTPAEAASRLYLAAYSRRPSSSESRLAGELWKFHGGDSPSALTDLWWALLNSNEFILNH